MTREFDISYTYSTFLLLGTAGLAVRGNFMPNQLSPTSTHRLTILRPVLSVSRRAGSDGKLYENEFSKLQKIVSSSPPPKHFGPSCNIALSSPGSNYSRVMSSWVGEQVFRGILIFLGRAQTLTPLRRWQPMSLGFVLG